MPLDEHRSIERFNGPCSRNGPTATSTAQKPTAQPPTPTGSITTITTAATPHSKASHQPTACPTCQDRTL